MEEIVKRQRGGYKPKILSEENLLMLERWVEDDPQSTLVELQARLFLDHQIQISTSALHRALDCRTFTLNDPHYEPLQMNCDVNKQKRNEYVEALRNVIANGKIPIWIDETNFNVFTARTKARSKRGQRARIIRHAPQKGKNLHIIGAMTTQGFKHFSHMRGSYKSSLANDWVRNMLRAAKNHFDSLDDILVIADNAPCHVR